MTIDDIDVDGDITIEGLRARDKGSAIELTGKIRCLARGETLEEAKANLVAIVRRALEVDRAKEN